MGRKTTCWTKNALGVDTGDRPCVIVEDGWNIQKPVKNGDGSYFHH
jgi:hypothetical protein